MSPYSTEHISFNLIDTGKRIPDKTKLRLWIKNTIRREGKKTGEISYNFCSDSHLLQINKKYLNHDYYTDIITFDLCEADVISGDIYISLDRVKENAGTAHTTFHVELSRVLIHGVLHLCGYKDKTRKDREIMRAKEDYYLSLLLK